MSSLQSIRLPHLARRRPALLDLLLILFGAVLAYWLVPMVPEGIIF
jgi:hypothetical protein